MAIEIPELSTLKIAKLSASTNGSGVATILLKIPGTAGVANQRIIYSGQGWFDNPASGDVINSIEIIDHDNILGYGVDTVLGSYTEEDLTSTEKGWFIPHHDPVVHMENVGGPGHLMGGLYLKVIVTAIANRSDTFRMNVRWGKPE